MKKLVFVGLLALTAVFNGFAQETEVQKLTRERNEYLEELNNYKQALVMAKSYIDEGRRITKASSEILHGSAEFIKESDLYACRRVAQKQTGFLAEMTGEAVRPGDFEKCAKSLMINIYLAGYRTGAKEAREEVSKASQPIQ
jgi:hypothetical protein